MLKMKHVFFKYIILADSFRVELHCDGKIIVVPRSQTIKVDSVNDRNTDSINYDSIQTPMYSAKTPAVSGYKTPAYDSMTPAYISDNINASNAWSTAETPYNATGSFGAYDDDDYYTNTKTKAVEDSDEGDDDDDDDINSQTWAIPGVKVIVRGKIGYITKYDIPNVTIDIDGEIDTCLLASVKPAPIDNDDDKVIVINKDSEYFGKKGVVKDINDSSCLITFDNGVEEMLGKRYLAPCK